uniref:SUI1 domain-containing protein n=1 Tax=Panagrolaimus sp. JU765 TaxID=591449 RepID=A0AC34RDZ5_9BILA
MFKNPFKIKSNTNIKTSDRKKLISKLGEDCSDLFGKSPFSIAVATLSNDETINLYICEKQPLYFEPAKNQLYPTVYLGWLAPKAFPTLFVSEEVFHYLQNGADLMLPGVIINEEKLGKFPEFNFGAAVCISIFSAKRNIVQGPIAVGKALMSSQEMINCGMKGKGVNVLHIYQDELWTYGHRETLPTFDGDVFFAPKPEETIADAPEVGVDEAAEEVQNIILDENNIVQDVPQQEDEMSDEFLKQMFLCALKYYLSKDQKFPMDVGQFYASVVLKAVPEGRKIDFKKTKYKKFINFLNEMNASAGKNNWFVQIASKKNIDSITQVNIDHPEVKNAEKLTDSTEINDKSTAGRVRMAECFTLTDASINSLHLLFPQSKYKKGDVIHPNQVAELVKEYVKEKNLTKPGNKTSLDENLQMVMKIFVPQTVGINDVIQNLTKNMTKAYLITTPDGRQFLKKTKLPTIVFQIEKRAGNKQVTLISNVTEFGIDAKELQSKIQNGISTGATIIPEAVCCVGPQILVNGNQINFVANLLMETYKIPKQYIKGMELGVKTKKGK